MPDFIAFARGASLESPEWQSHPQMNRKKFEFEWDYTGRNTVMPLGAAARSD